MHLKLWCNIQHNLVLRAGYLRSRANARTYSCTTVNVAASVKEAYCHIVALPQASAIATHTLETTSFVSFCKESNPPLENYFKIRAQRPPSAYAAAAQPTLSAWKPPFAGRLLRAFCGLSARSVDPEYAFHRCGSDRICRGALLQLFSAVREGFRKDFPEPPHPPLRLSSRQAELTAAAIASFSRQAECTVGRHCVFFPPS